MRSAENYEIGIYESTFRPKPYHGGEAVFLADDHTLEFRPRRLLNPSSASTEEVFRELLKVVKGKDLIICGDCLDLAERLVPYAERAKKAGALGITICTVRIQFSLAELDLFGKAKEEGIISFLVTASTNPLK